jgi:amidase
VADPVLGGLPLDRITVLDMQRAMRQRRLSSSALTRFYLARVHALNPKLHAVIETNPDAPREAAASDRRRRRYDARGVLEGIPVLVKDNIDTADRQQTTAGSLALVGSRPARDAALVSRLRAAGAVVLGKANLSEWANVRSTRASSGWSARGGQTSNPYVLDRNPCGSSSGSAAAAAASLAAVTIGTETDGSIMCPAGRSGVVGIKPTLGLVSRSGIVPVSVRQDTAGPITRNVTDAAAVLSVIQGVDTADRATASAGQWARRDYLDDLGRRSLRDKRIGVWRGGGQNAEVNAVLQRSVAVLRAQGATVVDDVKLVGMDVVDANEGPALRTEFRHDINAYLAARPGSHPANLAGLISFNKAHADTELRYFGQETFETAERTTGDLHDPTYRAARRAATSAARAAIDGAVAKHHLDAIFAPTNGPAWLTDLRHGDDVRGWVGSSSAAAVSGYPNITVPAGYARGELPLGMSFFGGRWSEPTLISLAYGFEQATHARHPPRLLPTIGASSIRGSCRGCRAVRRETSPHKAGATDRSSGPASRAE